MRNVPMIISRTIHIFEPLLQLIMSAYLHRWQAFNHITKFILKNLVITHQLSSGKSVTQSVGHNLIVHGTTGRNGTVLG